MRLNSDVELLDGMPIAHIKSIDAIVCTDLHLGYEGVISKNGVLLPKANLKSIESMIDSAIASTGASHIIVDGDIKNEFSGVDTEEFNELYEFIHFVSEKNVSLVLIKGNHDNFVERYRDAFKFQVYRQQHEYGGYFFMHGEELPRSIPKSTKMLVMGHEHPAITIYTDAGKAEKVRCFLLGSYKNFPLLVLPAMSYYSPGNAMNIVPRSELLAPIFRYVDVDAMEAIAVGYGSTLSFGKIGELRKFAESQK
ncbi:MAG: metallophosphoesterase [Candidatus Micrarchaeia archaeon]